MLGMVKPCGVHTPSRARESMLGCDHAADRLKLTSKRDRRTFTVLWLKFRLKRIHLAPFKLLPEGIGC
jgi:hypothetical protein